MALAVTLAAKNPTGESVPLERPPAVAEFDSYYEKLINFEKPSSLPFDSYHSFVVDAEPNDLGLPAWLYDELLEEVFG